MLDLKFEDNFKGDTSSLLYSSRAFLDIAQDDAFVPRVPNTAVKLVESLAARLKDQPKVSDKDQMISLAKRILNQIGDCAAIPSGRKDFLEQDTSRLIQYLQRL